MARPININDSFHLKWNPIDGYVNVFNSIMLLLANILKIFQAEKTSAPSATFNLIINSKISVTFKSLTLYIIQKCITDVSVASEDSLI